MLIPQPPFLIHSQSFPIERCTRHGCPLSPLFALSLEPLAQAVCQPEVILPISEVHFTSHHISLIADDILLFLDNPVLSVPHVLNVFNQFSNLSGLQN